MTHPSVSATASSLWDSARDTISGNPTLLCGGVAASAISAWAGWQLASRMTAATVIVPSDREPATETEAEAEVESDPEETETASGKPHTEPQTVVDELAEKWLREAHQYRVLYHDIYTSRSTLQDKYTQYEALDEQVVAHLGLHLPNSTAADAVSMVILAPFRQLCKEDDTFLAGMTKVGVFKSPLI